MITQTGELPQGIEKDGAWHNGFTMRAASIADTITAIEKSESALNVLSMNAQLNDWLTDLENTVSETLAVDVVKKKLRQLVAAKQGGEVSGLRLRVYEIAEQLEYLGHLSGSDITADVVLSLHSCDLGVLLDAQDALEKKRDGLRNGSSPTLS